MKRGFDFLVSLSLIIVLLPLIVIIACLVRLKLGSPVLFKQERPGLSNKPFTFYKFRSMTDEKDKDGTLLADDKRLTPFGLFLRKFSLDELPQLLNVLKGELSLVGPRPLLMEYLPLYTEEHLQRHRVRPGITGWAQINGRNNLSWEEKFDLDVWYVNNRSFWLDIKILLLTGYKVFKSEGINQPGTATAEKFRGLNSEVGGGHE
ncbi:sugar transferase [Salipaludibacillus aurantiacus]|uniref:Sugar transferase EpsL n=1 Tax=Salipaludibacillus aurantiacus TaxID=1601833 RepID=A0A1H9TPI4_9BACI|nr:sugar transferase [Salipaludibacillus aurantiacus]SER99062.1 sugar transferase EpsL [Salipaludibacillus aurantiacus]